MFTKVVIVLFSLVLGFVADLSMFEKSVYSADKVGEEILLAEQELADTFACPQFDQVASYLQYGLSNETSACSPFIWTDVEHFQSLGTFPMQYMDAFDVDTQAAVGNTVEVFRVKIYGVQLFAIRDLIDEHAFDQRVGLLGGIAYEIWEETPGAT